MKQFNLEEYLQNPSRPIVTRDGRKARIICADANSDNGPIVALIKNESGKDVPFTYFESGKYYDQIMQMPECELDLFFVPVKKEGWMNLYKMSYCDAEGGIVYDSEEQAKKIANGDKDCITTIKIEWEE